MYSRDFIFVAMENWDGVWRRNQPVAAGFARRHPDKKILFVGLTIDVSHLVRRRRFGDLWRSLRGSGKLPSPVNLPNIFLLNPIKLLPNTLSWGRKFNQWHERRQIRQAVKSLQIQSPILWMNPYYALHLVGQMGEVISVYDVGDDWTSFSQKEWFRQLVIAEDNDLTRKASAVIVVSQRLFEMKQGMSRRLHHIPNGVYLERYAAVCQRTLPRHPVTADWKYPVLAYTGTLHSERVDIDLVIALARRFRAGTVALVGPIQVDAATRQRLEAEPNIKLTGPVEFEQMPQVMGAFDVCIVPHLVTPFTESLSPLKLYEYLASGLPTVSTPVSGFRDFPELIYLASDEAAFAEGVQKALCESPEMPSRRQKAAAEHTWDARMDAIEAVVESCFENPAGPMEKVSQAKVAQ
jgi:glycosyltransferase involved in cell wall biosynthesis